MPQALLHDFWILSLVEQVGCMTVPEIVKTDPGEPCPLDYSTKVPSHNIIGVEGLPIGLAEDQSLVLVVIAQEFLFLPTLVP